jgi:general secretion pathway protein H
MHPQPVTSRLRRRTGSRGFTLIEILVVVVIIGIVVSMATLSVSVLGRDNQTEEQARRLWAILRQAREEAELQGLNIGLYFAAEEYEFLRFDPLTSFWVPIGGDKLYATRKLPEDLRYRIWLDSREIVLKPRLPERSTPDAGDADDEEAELPQALRTIDRLRTPPSPENPPQIVLLASGDIMPFELQIERERAPALWRIVATPDNDLRVEQRRDSSDTWQIVAQTTPPLDTREATANARNSQSR